MVASFAQQTQSKYHNGNIFLYIEEITLEKFSTSKQPSKLSALQSYTRHAVFHYFLYGDSKKYAGTTFGHS